ncbi:MAG TPA: MMPL family transporter [Euzebyales bacterium]
MGEQGGEPAVVSIEADLRDPAAVAALDRFAEDVRQLDSERFARDDDGVVDLDTGLLVAGIVMRSLRSALISVVPILLVVTRLYALMYAWGYSLNLVTATIGAISIGVGIDFAIHLVMRYREELAYRGERESALRAAGEGTGTALVASAVSSIAGFAILAFAPMPLFASYGLLTAVMIALALVATLLVIPPLLWVATARPAPPSSNAHDGRVPVMTS